MRSILAVLLENEAGALSRVVGLFAQRNYNIESLSVAPTEDPTLSRLTLTTSGDENKITQIRKQLDKLVEVVRVVDLCESPYVERELLLIKVSAQGEAREEVKPARLLAVQVALACVAPASLGVVQVRAGVVRAAEDFQNVVLSAVGSNGPQ